ncbi:hypothetical protein GH714_024384 [Hevea brasiliensis]|uniref:CBS domain-containing protein n=1 Tax=Hevea brasiliensis TaxID=3981 RepID=A0A6A6MGD9_HEVBR|nr:hypothetical protein GH714_024384 [Hevea brasiliensis]
MATVQLVRESEVAETLETSPRSPEAKLGMKVEDLWDVQEPQLSPTEKLNACFESIPVSAFLLELHLKSEAPSPRSQSFDTALAVAANGLTNAAGLGTLGPEDASATSGNFFEALTSSEFYKNMKVRDISGSFRWVPFLALQQSNSFLTMLLLLSKYKMKSVPVIALGDGKIDSIITQSAVIHMLAECAGLQWFESWGTKKLSEIGLPSMSHNHIIKWIQMTYFNRSITAKNFLTAVRSYLKEHHETSPMLSGMITCTKDHTIKELILKLDSEKIHRIYVVDDAGNLEGVITLRDVISRLVHEPPGYFGDFFDGVLPWPQNSRV